jgi:hypothetical protein
MMREMPACWHPLWAVGPFTLMIKFTATGVRTMLVTACKGLKLFSSTSHSNDRSQQIVSSEDPC